MMIEEKKVIDYLIFLKYENSSTKEDMIDKVIALVERQSKEIEFYKREELGYIAGYEDGKRHKQTAVAMRNENAQYEIIRKNIEIKDAKIEQLQKQIEELKEPKYLYNAHTGEINRLDNSNYIRKDKLKELMNKYDYYGDSDFETELNKLLEE